MSEITFARDVLRVNYLYAHQVEYLSKEHEIALDKAEEILEKLGISKEF